MPDLAPDELRITELQATRLAKITGLDAADLSGRTVVDLREDLRWRVDPELFLFRRVCGRVVRRDPVSGALLPVPHATVHVEDTDLNLLWFTPPGWPWGWFFPFFTRREELTSVVTDSCGNFCVFVPRWDIDWILRWRRERICPVMFVKPSVRETLEGLRPVPDPPPDVEWPPIKPPRPEPDPAPFRLKPGTMLRRAEELVGRTTARALVSAPATARTATSTDLLDTARFPHRLRPPLPTEFERFGKGDAPKVLAKRVNLEADALREIDLRRFLGPFWLCHDVIVPEWTPLFDVPDITFRVTQDVNGDGVEEDIYTEGFFDVRWNAGAIPDVTLEASAIALAAVACGTPPVACVDVEAITRIGLMPVEPPAGDPYLDPATGYSRRPNRPHPSGHFVELGPPQLATAPFLNTLQLYGCHHRAGASKYRVMHSIDGGPRMPLLVPSWPMSRTNPHPLPHNTTITQDPNGWLDILADAEGWEPDHLLVNWPTGAPGLYALDLEFADAALNPVGTPTPPIGIRVDNGAPLAQLAVAWKRLGAPGPHAPLGSLCPVVDRPVGTDLEFRVDYTVAAGHLRSISLSGGGCGGDTPHLSSAVPPQWEPIGPAGSPTGLQHWHVGELDNGVAASATFQLLAAAPRGVYSFSLWADSRAFNPSGGDGGFEADWNYDPVYRFSNPIFTFAVNDV